MFINTYIWEELLTARLPWAGAGQRVAAQGGWGGDRAGAGMCSACGCDSRTPRRLFEAVCAVQNRVTRWPPPPTTNPERVGGQCWLGVGAGLLWIGWAGSPPFSHEWCLQTPFLFVWLVTQPNRLILFFHCGSFSRAVFDCKAYIRVHRHTLSVPRNTQKIGTTHATSHAAYG